MNTCTICRNRFEAESPAVLFVSAYGTKRVLCPACEELLDKATVEETTPEREEARESLRTLASHMKDPEAYEMLGSILAGDVNSEDAPSEEEEAEMEAVLEEVRAEDEAIAKAENTPERLAAKKKAILIESLIYAGVGIAVIAFFVWFFFFT